MQKLLCAAFFGTGKKGKFTNGEWALKASRQGPQLLGLGWLLLGASLPGAAYPASPTADTDVLQTTIAGPATVGVGQVITWVATTQNVGPTDATGVVPTLQLPAGLSDVAVSAGTYNRTSGLVTFAALALPVGNSVASTVSFTAKSAGPYAGQAASTVGSPAETVLDNNNGTAPNANLTTVVTAQLCAASPAAIARDGSPADLGANGPDGGLVVNTYFPAGTSTQALAAGATSIAVGTPAGATGQGIAAGDLLLIIQMQGADLNQADTNTYGDGLAGDPASGYLLNASFVAGTYEYVTAGGSLAPGSGGTLALASGLLNAYINAPATATTGPRVFQVVRVPQYGNVTLAGDLGATQWDGTSGGVLVMEAAGNLNFAGYTISSGQRGFRGGQGRLLTTIPTAFDYVAPTDETTAYGQKGESLAGAPKYLRYYDEFNNTLLVTNPAGDTYPAGGASRGAPANGGGGTSQAQGGGGGGGGAGPGGRGGHDTNNNPATPGFVDRRAFGGAPVLQAANSRLVMGGGGGSGVANNDATANADVAARFTSGSQGGGITIIRAGSVAGSGTVDASGHDSGSVTGDGTGVNASTGGGGAGGSILVALRDPSGLAGITATATGGKGGDNVNLDAPQFGPGGGGSGGFVFANGSFAAVYTGGGRPGYTQSSVNGGTTDSFGATAGTVGAAMALPATSSTGAGAASASGGAPGVAASADCEDAPTAAPDTYTTAAGTTLVLSGAAGTPTAGILTNDSDAVGGLDAASVDLDPATAGLQQGSAGSPVSVAGGTAYVDGAGRLVFMPAAGFAGAASLSYTVRDVYGKASNAALVRITVGAPLPVVLVAFAVQAVRNRDAQLTWTTASELNSAYFEVERSFDGVAFGAVGRVAAQGNKPTATSYALTDAGVGPRAAGNPVYYRLHQVDADSAAAYSAVQAVRFTEASTLAISIYPSPAAAGATLDLGSLPAGPYQVRLLNALGQVVRQLHGAGGQRQPLDLTGLAAGTYLVELAGPGPDGAALRLSQRLVKE